MTSQQHTHEATVDPNLRLRGLPSVDFGNGTHVRLATSSDDDCMFMAGCVDAATHRALRSCWARAAADADVPGEGYCNSALGPVRAWTSVDLQVQPAGFLEYSKFVIQHDESSWYHHSNALIVCTDSGARLRGVYLINPRTAPGFKSMLLDPDGQAFERLLFSMLNDPGQSAGLALPDDKDGPRMHASLGYAHGAAVAPHLDGALPQLRKFRGNVTRVMPPFGKWRDVLVGFARVHGLAGLCAISGDNSVKKIHRRMGFEEVTRVVQPVSGDVILGHVLRV